MKKPALVVIVAVVSLALARLALPFPSPVVFAPPPDLPLPAVVKEAKVRLVELGKDVSVDAPRSALASGHLASLKRSRVVSRFVMSVLVAGEQRDSLVAPGPSTIRVHLTVPWRAELDFAHVAVGGAATFVVRTKERELCRFAAGGAWTPARCDLAPVEGKTVDLELRNEGPDDHLALWGNPTIVTASEPRVPFDVVVGVTSAPFDAALVARGVLFSNAYAASNAPDAAILALLTGARPSELARGASSPLFLRKHGVRSVASIDQDVTDLGFERIVHGPLVTPTEGRSFSFFYRRGPLSPGGLDHTIVVLQGPTDESARAPLLLLAPGLAPAVVNARVRTVDVVPTIFELLGLEAPIKGGGRSLLALARGRAEPDERVALIEGPTSRALVQGRHRYVAHGKGEELFDLADPTSDLAKTSPSLLAEMRARMAAASKDIPVAGTAAARTTASERAVVHLRFVGGGKVTRFSGDISVLGPPGRVGVTVEPFGLGPEAFSAFGTKVTIAVDTVTDAVVGLDLVVEPKDASVQWSLRLGEEPLPGDAVFAGRFGLASPSLQHGVIPELANGARLPFIDPLRDRGMFVVRGQKTL